MRSCHNLSARFDDPNLVSCAGLIPVMTLAERAGLHDLARAHVRVPGSAGSNADVKVGALVAGMVAGADTIDAMDLLRHGGMGRVFTAGRAPSTLGTFLRAFTFGHVRQLDAVASRVLVNLAGSAPLLTGAGQVAYLDIDDTIKATYGYAKQGAGYGYSKVKGLNALLAIISTPLSAPLIAATRLRKGSTYSPKGASRLVADALATVKRAGATGLITVRADSAYYIHDVIAAARRGGARFSVTARMDPAVSRAITHIPDDAWVPIKYARAIYDQEEQRWVSDAQVAETSFTAFTSHKKSEHIGARLIVRRVKRLNPKTVPAGQGALFSTWRHHAVFTDSAESMLAAEATHRDHAIMEKVIAELKNGPLAHLPSASFAANSAWTVLAAIAFNLTRAAGTLASRFHARATTATIRAQLIAVPARIARSARRLRLHLPERWPWEHGLAGDVHRRRRTTRLRDLTTQPQRRNQGPEVEDPDRPAAHPRPNQKRRPSDQIRTHRNKSRWIEGEPLAIALRPGNAGSNTAADHIAVITAALRQLPGDRRRGKSVLVRIDGAGSTHKVIDWLTGRRLAYSVGFTLPENTPDLLELIPEHVWTEAYDAHDQVRDGAWVAELTHLMDLTG